MASKPPVTTGLIAQQIEKAADIYEPGVYSLLSFYSSFQQVAEDMQEQFVPISMARTPATKDTRMFVVGILPPSSNVTGKQLDRSASVSAVTGTAGVADTAASLSLRDRALELLKAIDGLGNDPRSRGKDASNAYAQFLVPVPPNRQELQDAERASGSSCAATARAYLRTLGCDDPRIQGPYKGAGSAPGDIMQAAEAKGAVSYSGKGDPPPPQPGDIYYAYTYYPPPAHAQQHVGIIKAVHGDPASGDFWVDEEGGGQWDGNTIKSGKRKFHRNEDGTWSAIGYNDPNNVKGLARMYNLDKLVGDAAPTVGGPVVGDVAGDTRFQGDGQAKAAMAKKATDKTSNTSLPNDTVLGQGLQAAQKAIINDTIAAIDRMAQTPPLRMLVAPSSFRVSSEKVIADGNWTRKGLGYIEHWGDAQDKIEGSGTLAGFYSIDREQGNGPGLGRNARNLSMSFQNFLSLWLIYRNNGGVWLHDYNSPTTERTNLSVVGSIYIFYDNVLYLGSFDSFTMNEADTAPFTLEYSFSFTVRAQFLLDQPDNAFTYQAPPTDTSTKIPTQTASAEGSSVPLPGRTGDPLEGLDGASWEQTNAELAAVGARIDKAHGIPTHTKKK